MHRRLIDMRMRIPGKARPGTVTRRDGDLVIPSPARRSLAGPKTAVNKTLRLLVLASFRCDTAYFVRCPRRRKMAWVVARKVTLLCLLLAVVRRAAGQGTIGGSLPCEGPGQNPDPNNDADNLSCPNTDQTILQCYSEAELCNGIPFCNGGSDEGTDLVALDCKFAESLVYSVVCPKSLDILEG